MTYSNPASKSALAPFTVLAALVVYSLLSVLWSMVQAEGLEIQEVRFGDDTIKKQVGVFELNALPNCMHTCVSSMHSSSLFWFTFQTEDFPSKQYELCKVEKKCGKCNAEGEEVCIC